MSKERSYVRPETNNLRRLLVARKYSSMKAFADELGENPVAFRKYFRKNKPIIPQIDKLEKWSRILKFEVSEFFVIRDIVEWPLPLKPHKTVHKKGLSYRESLELRESLRQMVAEDSINEEEIRWFLEG